MAPELVAGGGYGGLIREKPHCAAVRDVGCRNWHSGVPEPVQRSFGAAFRVSVFCFDDLITRREKSEMGWSGSGLVGVKGGWGSGHRAI